MNTICSRKRIIAVLGFLIAQQVFASASLEAFLNTPDFKQYLLCLNSCQKKYPEKYLPLELIRVDLLSENDFVSNAKSFASQWRDLGKKTYKKKVQEDMDTLSCKANDSLLDVVRAAESKLGRTLKGSSVSVVRFIPSELRTGLSAIDSVFLKSSDVGKKAFKDLEQKPQMNLMAVTFDDKRQVIDFEGLPGAWANLNMLPRPYYELKYSEFQDDKILFRGGYLGNNDPVGSDLVIRRVYLEGRTFNPKSQSPLPLGPYPQTKDLWVDETGLSHFQGDGHNHSHSH